MDKAIRMLCVLSVFCALAMNLIPEGRERRVMSFVCSVVLLASALRYAREPDWEIFALETAQLRQREKVFLENAEQLTDQLQRVVIEEECETYILNKARQMQIDLASVEITAQWSMEGLWIPYSAVLTGETGDERRALFSALLESELGIPSTRQEWRSDGS